MHLQLGHQTDCECDETWQAVYLHYNKTARQLSSHSENIFMPLIKQYFGGVAGRVQVCLCSEWRTDRSGGTRTDASFEKHADEMQMMTWQNATRKQMTWQRWRITGGHLAHRIRGVTIALSSKKL